MSEESKQMTGMMARREGLPVEVLLEAPEVQNLGVFGSSAVGFLAQLQAEDILIYWRTPTRFENDRLLFVCNTSLPP